MRNILSVFISLISINAAFAQPPTEVQPEAEIYLSTGQVKILRFDEPIASVVVVTKGQIEAAPQSDRQISIAGIAPGETRMMVLGPDGKSIYSAAVTVSEPGRLVKFYGTGKNDDVNAGFVAVYCDELGCGRPDKDLPPAQLSVQRLSRSPKDKP